MLRAYTLLCCVHIGVAFRTKQNSKGNVIQNESAGSHPINEIKQMVAASLEAVEAAVAGMHKETPMSKKRSAHSEKKDVHRPRVEGSEQLHDDMIEKAKSFNVTFDAVVDKARSLVELVDNGNNQHHHQETAKSKAASLVSFIAGALLGVVVCFILLRMFGMRAMPASVSSENVQPPAAIEGDNVDAAENTDLDPPTSKSVCLPYAKQISSPSQRQANVPYMKSSSFESSSLNSPRNANPYGGIRSPSQKSTPYGMPPPRASSEPKAKAEVSGASSAKRHSDPYAIAAKTAPPPQAQMEESNRDVSQSDSSGLSNRRAQMPYGPPTSFNRAQEQDPDTNADAS